ncbi:MAG: hypothetical protein RIR31_499 [Bacteroidota bacterium]|jgi:hypothetical protein
MRKFTHLLLTGLILLLFSSLGIAQKQQSAALHKAELLKTSKTPVSLSQSKMDSQLWDVLQKGNQQSLKSDVAIVPKSLNQSATQNINVDITCMVTATLLQSIKTAGGEIIFSSAEADIIKAQIPVLALEQFATRKDVKFIAQSDLSARQTGVKSLTPVNNQKLLQSQSIRTARAEN